ncbi:MAG TPA: metallopeptidase family protein [bacterium]|nr:metallopeptidase family protein [bacterium]
MLSEEEFEAVVDEALDELPPDLSEKIHNVDIFIEDYPSREIQEEMGVSRRGLLGFYTGIPQNHRGAYYGNVLPDRIYLYKKNLESVCHSREELKDQIRRTVLHEIGHYFGIDDKRLRELGY